MQFCGHGRRCDHAATVGVSCTVAVPQILFIAPFEDIPIVQQRRVRFQLGYGGDEWDFQPF